VAVALRDWLPSVLQSIDPYVSSEDIEKGARWSVNIGQQLNDTSFGVLCVTKENLESPWLNFEAGALSKSLESSRVSPLLVGGIRPAELVGPLSQFQATLPHLDDIMRLIKSMNSASERAIDEVRLVEAVTMWWPRLEQQLADAVAEQEEVQQEPQRETREMIAELLEITRGVQRQLLRAETEELQESRVSTDAIQRRERRDEQLLIEVRDVLEAASVTNWVWRMDADTVRIVIREVPTSEVSWILDRVAAKYGRKLSLSLRPTEPPHEEPE
jgi:hypothetical protein